jgi:hypothetical protein
MTTKSDGFDSNRVDQYMVGGRCPRLPPIDRNVGRVTRVDELSAQPDMACVTYVCRLLPRAASSSMSSVCTC